MRVGKLKRLSCEQCGSPETEAHHIDYDKPEDIIWLCNNHHREWHIRHDKVGWRPRRVIRFSHSDWSKLNTIRLRLDKPIEEILSRLILTEWMRVLDDVKTEKPLRKGMGQSAHNNLPPGYTDRDL